VQAEDGIRDRNVTGVQTCALPICYRNQRGSQRQGSTVDYSGVEVTSQVVGAKPVAGTGGLQRLGSVTGVGIARGEDPRGKRGNYYEQQKCASQSQAEFGYPTAASAFEFWSAGVICW